MSYKIYQVTKTDLFCDSYTVKINGKIVALDTARVSAMPFNRRWPGHQRSIDQTELVNFLNLETDEALEFEIIPKLPFEKVEIRPLTHGQDAEHNVSNVTVRNIFVNGKPMENDGYIAEINEFTEKIVIE